MMRGSSRDFVEPACTLAIINLLRKNGVNSLGPASRLHPPTARRRVIVHGLQCGYILVTASYGITSIRGVCVSPAVRAKRLTKSLV